MNENKPLREARNKSPKVRKPLTENQKQVITIVSIVVSIILVLSLIACIVIFGGADNGSASGGDNTSVGSGESNIGSGSGSSSNNSGINGTELPIIPLD